MPIARLHIVHRLWVQETARLRLYLSRMSAEPPPRLRRTVGYVPSTRTAGTLAVPHACRVSERAIQPMLGRLVPQQLSQRIDRQLMQHELLAVSHLRPARRLS